MSGTASRSGSGADVWQALDERGAGRCVLWTDRASGLRAILVIDDLTLGPGAGGVRTRAYPSLVAAVDDAARLARAMTIKCALGGLAAGGAKAVVLDHPGLDRPRAFRRLGRFVQELGGLFRTAGDLGTTAADLDAMAAECEYVHTDERGLADAVARGLLRCVEACASVRGLDVAGLRVAVQGCGAIGAACARALHAAGAELLVADLDAARARDLADELGAQVIDPDSIFTADVDLVCPCAAGGVITADVARALRAWALCGAANNLVADADAARVLADRRILHVPDVVASAGAVIEGIGRTIMHLPDRTPLIDALARTARTILERSLATGTPADAIARQLAGDGLQESNFFGSGFTPGG